MNRDTPPQSTVPMDELRRIVKLMKDNELSEFQFEKEGFKVKLRRGGDAPAAAATIPAPQQTIPHLAAPAAAPAKAEGIEITSPMVGTFYVSSSPEAAPFVSVGDTVSVGQTVCIIEAMKVMNEIKADKAGVIAAIVADDGTPVQFGAPLFLLK